MGRRIFPGVLGGGDRGSMTSVDLLRRLGFKESFAIVVGSVIGTGIFLKTAAMAQDAGSPLYVLLALLTAGGLSFMGALIYAELGCLFPAAGGEYVFCARPTARSPDFSMA